MKVRRQDPGGEEGEEVEDPGGRKVRRQRIQVGKR